MKDRRFPGGHPAEHWIPVLKVFQTVELCLGLTTEEAFQWCVLMSAAT
jgi:hypothetical protein